MNPVHIILDEAAILGPMQAIDSAVGIGRGYGIKFQFYYQSLGQLRMCFPEGQDQTLLSNTTQIYFSTNDNATAEYVSNRLGEQTIVLDSGGTSDGSSWQSSNGEHPSTSSGTSSNANYNWQLQARRLLKPEEVAALPARMAITFTPGVPPVCTWLIRHYEEKNLLAKARQRCRSHGSGRELVRSILRCIAALGLAALITHQFIRIRERPQWLPANRQVETR